MAERFAVPDSGSATAGIGNCTALQELNLQYCKKLQSVPESEFA